MNVFAGGKRGENRFLMKLRGSRDDHGLDLIARKKIRHRGKNSRSRRSGHALGALKVNLGDSNQPGPRDSSQSLCPQTSNTPGAY